MIFKSCVLLFVLILYLTCYTVCASQIQYTDKEKAALEKFRELVKDDVYKDYMSSDPYLVRWIRSRNFDLTEARKMLQAALKWRKDNKIDGILKENIQEFQSPPFYADGIDREGSMVAILIPGRVDMRRYLLNGRRADAIRYWIQLQENMEMSSLELLRIVPEGSSPLLNTTGLDRSKLTTADKGNVIMDLGGYNLIQHSCLSCFSVYLEWMNIMEKYYPGYLKKFFMVNAPRVFVPLLQILKTAMSPTTRNALEVYGSNKNEWGPVLHKLIPPDQLRANLGGTKKD